jgi:hypothetical protein
VTGLACRALPGLVEGGADPVDGSDSWYDYGQATGDTAQMLLTILTLPTGTAEADAAEEGGSQVLLDTGSVIKYNGAQGLLGESEQPVVNETVERELGEVAARKGFSGALSDGVSVISDDTGMTLRGQVMQQLRMFGAASQGMENDAAVGATALGRGMPLITTDNALANAVMKLGGEVRFLEP